MTSSRPAFTPHLTPIAPDPDAMSTDDLARVLRQLELSQTAAARLLGVDERTMRRWIVGRYPVAPTAARFLRFLARAKISPISVMETLAS